MTERRDERPADEFTSDEPMAAELDEFTSDEPMPPGKKPAAEKKFPSMRERAQRGLGWVIVGTAMVSYLLVVLFYLFDWTDTSDKLDQVVTSVFAGMQTLVAAVIGFYFGTREQN